MTTVNADQALETYEMTIKNELPESYADWITAIANALNTGDDSELDKYPSYVREVFNMKWKKKSISLRILRNIGRSSSIYESTKPKS